MDARFENAIGYELDVLDEQSKLPARSTRALNRGIDGFSLITDAIS